MGATGMSWEPEQLIGAWQDLNAASPPLPAGFGPAGPRLQRGAHPLTSKMASCHVLPRQAGSRDLTVQAWLDQSDCRRSFAQPISSLIGRAWIASPLFSFPSIKTTMDPYLRGGERLAIYLLNHEKSNSVCSCLETDFEEKSRTVVIILIEMYNMNSYNYGSTLEAVSVHWRQLAL